MYECGLKGAAVCWERCLFLILSTINFIIIFVCLMCFSAFMDDSGSDRMTLIEQPTRKRGRSRGRNGGGGDRTVEWGDEAQQMDTFSDSEALGDNKVVPRFQETAVFSDALSDAESLPSYRAMAASMKKEVKMVEKKETTPLLMENGGITRDGIANGLTGSDDSNETYSTLGQTGAGKKCPSLIKKW